MPNPGQHSFNANPPTHALSEIISPLRLGAYLNASGHDLDRALNLYLWNAKIGEAFHLPIQSVEVGLRNRVSDGLDAAFGADWWRNETFISHSTKKSISDIELVKRRLKGKGKPIITGQIVAGLSFGFWVSMLHKRYNSTIWAKHFRSSFPDIPISVDREALRAKVRNIADLRNRIWHHEPIFKRNLLDDYSHCMEALNWICPTKAAWIKPHCRVATVMRQKP